MLLTISAISSKKEIYLDKISSLGEEYLTLYLNLIEKYIIIDGDNYSSESSKLYVFNHLISLKLKHIWIRKINI